MMLPASLMHNLIRRREPMMKTVCKWTLSFVLALLLIAPLSKSAFAGNGLYLGLGGSYAYSKIDTESIPVLDDVDAKIDFGDTSGFNARLGWRMIDLVALELNFDYLPGFESDEVIRIFDIPSGVSAELDVMTLMVDAKLFPLRLGPLELDFFGGLGIMKAEVSGSTGMEVIDNAIDLSEEDTLLCGELGIGLGLNMGGLATFNLEGSYVAGLGKFGEYDYGIGYMLVTAGIDFYF
jgi:hypothetical protein